MKVQTSPNLLSAESTKSPKEGSGDLMQMLLGKTGAVEGKKDLTSFLPGQNVQMDSAQFMQEFTKAMAQETAGEQNLTAEQLLAQAKTKLGVNSQAVGADGKIVKVGKESNVQNLLSIVKGEINNSQENSPESTINELAQIIKASKVDGPLKTEKNGQQKIVIPQVGAEAITTSEDAKELSAEAKLNKLFSSGAIPVKSEGAELSLKNNKKQDTNANVQSVEAIERSRGLKAYGESAPLNASLISKKNVINSNVKDEKSKAQKIENLSDSILNINNNNSSNSNVDVTKVVNASRPIAQVNMSNVPSSAPVFDMSKMNSSQSEQIIQQVTQYLQQSQIRNGKELNLTVNHESLGQFKINARKMKEGDGINLEINTMGDAAHKFFTKHENDLMSKLSLSGVKISDYKVSSSPQQQSTSFDMSNQDQSKSGQSFGQMQGDMMNSKNGEQRRKEMWQYYQSYKEGMAA